MLLYGGQNHDVCECLEDENQCKYFYANCLMLKRITTVNMGWKKTWTTHFLDLRVYIHAYLLWLMIFRVCFARPDLGKVSFVLQGDNETDLPDSYLTTEVISECLEEVAKTLPTGKVTRYVWTVFTLRRVKVQGFLNLVLLRFENPFTFNP